VGTAATAGGGGLGAGAERNCGRRKRAARKAVNKAIETAARSVDGVMEVRSKMVFIPVCPGT
jgi:hypothetical protein